VISCSRRAPRCRNRAQVSSASSAGAEDYRAALRRHRSWPATIALFVVSTGGWFGFLGIFGTGLVLHLPLWAGIALSRLGVRDCVHGCRVSTSRRTSATEIAAPASSKKHSYATEWYRTIDVPTD
jgi:hypothetical protein